MPRRHFCLTFALLFGSAAWAQDRVVVLDPGQEPRQELRYTPKKAKAEEMRMTMSMAMAMSMAGVDMASTRIPPIIMDMDILEVQTATNGDVSYRFVLSGVAVGESIESAPGMSEALLASLDPLVGTAGSVRISSTGQTLDWTLQPPPGADPTTISNMKQGMANSSAVLPTEAVGVGARWEQHSTVESNGLKVAQVTLYELLQMDKKHLSLKLAVQQSAPAQTFSPPGMPPGANARLDSMSTQGQGTSAVRLDRLVPTGSIQIHSDFAMGFSMEGQDIPLTMSLDLETLVEPR